MSSITLTKSQKEYAWHIGAAVVLLVVGLLGVLPAHGTIGKPGALTLELWPPSALTLGADLIFIVGTAKRLSSLGRSKWWTPLSVFLPFGLNYLFVLWLLFLAKPKQDPPFTGRYS